MAENGSLLGFGEHARRRDHIVNNYWFFPIAHANLWVDIRRIVVNVDMDIARKYIQSVTCIGTRRLQFMGGLLNINRYCTVTISSNQGRGN